MNNSELENTAPIKVLLVDDDEEDYLIIKNVFSRIPDSPFVLSWSPSYDEAKRHIEHRNFDLYLIDYRLGAYSGLDLLRFAEPEKRLEPFILLTGVGDRDVEKKSMQLAAADYLVKGAFGPELLSRTLLYSLGRKRIEQQRLEHLMELSRTKDEFISLASHQLRTPATAVKQFIGMLLQGFIGDMPEKQREILQKAYDSNERQLRIVSDLLKVAQVDAGKVNLKFSPTDVIELVKDVMKDLEVIYKERQQTLLFNTSMKKLIVNIDQERIHMVLENIIDNASKYSEKNTSVTISIKEDAKTFTINIKDQGVGIEPEHHGQLFEKFSRIHNPLSTQVGGTGLGLYWAHKIVYLHDGSIEVESKAGKGTQFSVRLPKSHEPAMLNSTAEE
jgi:signal transduction histidine kinase